MTRSLVVLLLALATLVGCGKGEGRADVQPRTLRIGYQKSSSLVVLKQRGTLEQALAPLAVRVAWAEFPSGPALLEALTGGQLDFGYTGEAPPIFAQAASSEMVYVAAEPSAPRAEAILVRAGSPIRRVEDLRGRNVALNKGSNVHYFLVQALERAGLRYEDVKVTFLPPADARAAFENGTVDAWAIWDPYLAAAEAAVKPRVLVTAEGVAPNNQFYLGRRAFIDAERDVVEVLLREITATDDWIRDHRSDAVAILAPLLGIESGSVETMLERAAWRLRPVDEATIQSQQRIADVFHRIGLLKEPLTVADALPRAKWKP